jgi:hypothetical protein
MDSADFNLEFQGTAMALRDPQIQALILSQPGGVALNAFEWGGQTHQRVIEGWTLMRSVEDIEAFAQKIVEHGRGSMGQHTGTGSAVEFGYVQLSTGPQCERLVVDISSDGYNNDGPAPTDFYATGAVDWITVNALVVGGKSRPELWDWFENEVIHGPGAFSVATFGFEDYAEAMVEKFLRELRPSALIARSELGILAYSLNDSRSGSTVSARDTIDSMRGPWNDIVSGGLGIVSDQILRSSVPPAI